MDFALFYIIQQWCDGLKSNNDSSFEGEIPNLKPFLAVKSIEFVV